jgi:hypothetical protein
MPLGLLRSWLKFQVREGVAEYWHSPLLSANDGFLENRHTEVKFHAKKFPLNFHAPEQDEKAALSSCEYDRFQHSCIFPFGN